MSGWYYTFFFGIYPYIALTVCAVGTLIRYDREPYTWRASSSQLLADNGIKIGNILFHIGVLFIFFGHFEGLLTPHSVYSHFTTAEDKKMLAVTAGGVAGVNCLIGLTLLIIRRLSVPRIRKTSSFWDMTILFMLLAQLGLGLSSIVFSLAEKDAETMLHLAEWAQRLLTFRSGGVELIKDVAWPFQMHLILGMTLFLVFPFTRLVHMLSVPVKYIGRPYQVVRSRMAIR